METLLKEFIFESRKTVLYLDVEIWVEVSKWNYWCSPMSWGKAKSNSNFFHFSWLFPSCGVLGYIFPALSVHLLLLLRKKSFLHHHPPPYFFYFFFFAEAFNLLYHELQKEKQLNSQPLKPLNTCWVVKGRSRKDCWLDFTPFGKDLPTTAQPSPL